MSGKKENKIFQKERLQTMNTKIMKLLMFKLLDFHRKKICVVMQSNNVV